MEPTQITSNKEMLEYINAVASDLASLLDKKNLTRQPDTFLTERAALISKIKQKRHIGDDVVITLDISEPISHEEKGKWHPHVRVRPAGDEYGDAYLHYNLPEE